MKSWKGKKEIFKGSKRRGVEKSKFKSKEKKEKVKKRRIQEREKEVKVLFWNVSGIKKKDRGFWEYVESCDIVGLTETGVEEKKWERVKSKFPMGFRWERQGTIKEKN